MTKRLIPSHTVPGGSSAPPSLRGTPIILSDSVEIGSSSQAPFASQSFTNTTSKPIDLHAMRVYCELQQETDAASRIVLPGLIALRVALDGIPLTRGFVPVWSFAPSDSREPVDAGVADYQHPAATWRFARPMPLMPGKTITIEAKHLGITNEAITVRVSFAGRLVASASPRYVPYAAVWTSKAFDAGTDDFDASPAGIVVNDTGRDLHVERIIGRFAAYNDANTAFGTRTQYADFGDETLQSVFSALVRMSLSKNRPVLKAYTPWRTVFGQNATVETDFDLAAGDYLIAEVHHLPSTLASARSYFQGRAFVSIVGGREA